MQHSFREANGNCTWHIEPVHDSLAVVLPNGAVVPFDGDLWAHYASGFSVETVRFYEQRAILWAKDLLFALDSLAQLSRDKSSRFYGVIDLRHVGTFGHSHGGRSAVTACLLDSRITACLNEDGRLDEGQLQRPLLANLGSSDKWNVWNARLVRSRAR